MKETLAFTERRNNRTALVVLGDRSLIGTYFCIEIEHEGGAYRKHPVNLHTSLENAMEAAETFLSNQEKK